MGSDGDGDTNADAAEEEATLMDAPHLPSTGTLTRDKWTWTAHSDTVEVNTDTATGTSAGADKDVMHRGDVVAQGRTAALWPTGRSSTDDLMLTAGSGTAMGPLRLKTNVRS